jgi:hypothetical protein
MPNWVPYSRAVAFAATKSAWISSQLAGVISSSLKNGQAIGKAHHLSLIRDENVANVSAKIAGTTIVVRYNQNNEFTDQIVQAAATKAAIRALRSEAVQLLPARLKTLAQTHALSYQSVHVRALKSRWGSCSQNKDITLSLYLMQLPWELIDYVLLHELTHTVILHHGADFWSKLEEFLPDAKTRRQAIKVYRARII